MGSRGLGTAEVTEPVGWVCSSRAHSSPWEGGLEWAQSPLLGFGYHCFCLSGTHLPPPLPFSSLPGEGEEGAQGFFLLYQAEKPAFPSLPTAHPPLRALGEFPFTAELSGERLPKAKYRADEEDGLDRKSK